MSVIALISTFPPSQQSLNEYGFHLANEFAKDPRVSRVVIIADQLDAPAAELSLDPKIEVQRVWSFNSKRASFQILRALTALRPDLALYNVQTASFGDRELPAALGLMTPLMSRMRGIYSGILAHNMISGVDLEDTILKGQPIRQRIVRFGGSVVSWLMMKANYVTVTLQSYYDDYHKRFPKADLTMVPHGTFDTQTAELVPWQDRDPIIVTMGKFGTYKRLETLLEAMEILRQEPRYKSVKLIIGGTDHPNCKGYMKSLEERYGGREDLVFHGYVAEDDIPAFFSQAQISVFDYSSTTGSSGVLHQTASYGVVPVFPAIGDFVDVCNAEGIYGENYAPNDAQDMAKALMRVFENPETSKEIAAQNKSASEEMPLSKVVDFHINKIAKP